MDECRKGRQMEDCDCVRLSSVGNLTYEDIASSFLKKKRGEYERLPIHLEAAIWAWLERYRPNWDQISEEDVRRIAFALRCRFSAKAVETKRKQAERKVLQEKKNKQPKFDF